MDLYIQVGVILLFLAALSLFVYFYTQPAQQFTEGINDTTKELNQRLETASGVNLKQYHLNTNVSGAQVKTLIKDSEASKIGLLVQTKSQKGLVVNYGGQLRPSHYEEIKMYPSAKASTEHTDFEKNYVTHAYAILDPYELNSSYTSVLTSNYRSSVSFYNAVHFKYNQPIETTTGHLGGGLTSDLVKTPTIFFAPGDKKFEDSFREGNYTSNTGLLYTNDTVLPKEFNTLVPKSSNSPYYIGDTQKFSSMLIVSTNGQVVGVYIEELKLETLDSVRIFNYFQRNYMK